MTNTVTLPFPPKELNPNARVHHMKLSKIKKLYMHECYVQAKKAGLRVASGDVLMTIEIYPPDRRKRDTDNIYASLKAGLDGIAKAIGIDDSEFNDVNLRKKKQVGGMIKITFSEVEEF